MRRHVDIGAEILECDADAPPSPRPPSAPRTSGSAAAAIRVSIAGAAIPLVSRIIAVADAYDAMTQDRAYRSSLDSADAVAELLRCTPAQFDPEIVAAFLAVLGRH